MRFLNRTGLKIVAAVLALAVLSGIAGLTLYLSSERFREDARAYIVRLLEERTGGGVTLDRFSWNLWQQRFRLDGLTIHGLEPQTAPPLAHIESIEVGVNFRSIFRRRLDLFLLQVNRPEFHLTVDANGKTNLPTPPTQQSGNFNLQLSIDNFTIASGVAALNERRVDIDFGIANLESSLNYRDATQVLSSQLQFDGALDRPGKKRIPYRLDGEFDYTRGTVLARRLQIQSGVTQVSAQGRIDDVLSNNIAGRLEYKGVLDIPFLNYFLDNENLDGAADVAGLLEFSRGFIFTRGSTSVKSVSFDGWRGNDVEGQYAYHYPDKRLTLRRLRAKIAGGSASGSVVVEPLPGDSRVSLDIDYNQIDAASLARAYPWDPKYRIHSRVSGSLSGWFEGRLTRFEFNGGANLTPYTAEPAAGVVSLPLEGGTQFDLRPGQVQVSNAAIKFLGTSIEADGLIDEKASNLNVKLSSTDLRNLSFIYVDANGSGSFEGSVTGPIKTPVATGDFVLNDYHYENWTIQHAAGNATVDTLAEVAQLRNVQVTQGTSTLEVSGSTTLNGRTVDLQLRAARLTGADLTPFITRKLEGVFSGSAHVTSLEPLQFEGDIQAVDLTVENRKIGNVRSRVQFREPVVELTNLTVTRNETTLTGNLGYNLRNEEIHFAVRLARLDLDSIRDLGLPQPVSGVIQDAELSGDGTRNQPNIRGQATVRSLSLYGETFNNARVRVQSSGSAVTVNLDAARNLSLTAQINTAGTGFPFNAQATFDTYSVEKLLGFNQGTLTLTGRVDLTGSLTDRSKLRGSGQIQTAEAEIQGRNLKAMKPFTFEFDSNRLTLASVSLSGTGTGNTAVSLAGVIGLTPEAPLNLDVMGSLDLGLLAATDPNLISSGTVNVDGRIGGTVRRPDLRGLAHFNNASFGRRGIFLSLSSLNGDVFFNENSATLNNLVGKAGGGTIQIQGSAIINQRTVESMNIRIETDDVRIRYPEGLRTVVDGTLVLRGSAAAPLLQGDLEIQSMTYRSEFEQFLAMLQTEGLSAPDSPLARLGLAVHVEGGRNITIQNQLADVEARIDLDIKGTVARPGLTGHVEASGGTLLFQGTRYEVTRGNIDFVDPLRVEPVVDVQAESDLRDYRVILTVSGRGNRMRFDMRSDPPLPQLEIVSLIAGGKTGEEVALATGGARPTSEQLFQGGAASILFDLLKQRVGSRFGLIGLDRIRIDPFLIGAESSPTARITIPLQVTKDLTVSYSRNIYNSQQDIIQIEYFVSKNMSILATRDEFGALSLDVKRRSRF